MFLVRRVPIVARLMWRRPRVGWLLWGVVCVLFFGLALWGWLKGKDARQMLELATMPGQQPGQSAAVGAAVPSSAQPDITQDFTAQWQPASEAELTQLFQQACKEQAVLLTQLSFANAQGGAGAVPSNGQAETGLAAMVVQAKLKGPYPATKRVLGHFFKSTPSAVLQQARWVAPAAGADAELALTLLVMQPPHEPRGGHAN